MGSNGRSASEKEKTKLRERERRSITTKIFHGLRKHGGYRLSPRADINQVLRHLAAEAGWVVEPDGTTYRSKVRDRCPVCGAAKTSGTPTPTSSFIRGGGDCSTTASPRHIPIGESLLGGGMAASTYFGGGSGGSGGSGGGASSSQDLTSDRDFRLALYMCGRLAGGGPHPSASFAAPAVTVAYQQQQLYLQEARASNQNTPAGSPHRRA